MSRRGYTATVMPDKRERRRMKRWDRKCGKTVHVDHGKESLKRAMVAEFSESIEVGRGKSHAYSNNEVLERNIEK